MRKIYKVVRFKYGRKITPVYYENLVDLVEELALSYYGVYVGDSKSLLEGIKSLCLIHHPEHFRSMQFYLYDVSGYPVVFSNSACVVSEVEVDQNGHLLSTSS